MAYRESTTNIGNSNTPSTAVPSGVQAGDIVLLIVNHDAYGNQNFSSAWPADFTHLDASECGGPNGQEVGLAWKRLTGSDSGSYTLSALTDSAQWCCQAIAFSGRHATDPPTYSVNINTTNNPSPVSVTATGLTAVEGDDLAWINCPDVYNAGYYTSTSPPVNYTEREDDEDNGGLSWACMAMATRENVSAGATGNVTGTMTLSATGSGYVAYLVRVPAAAGPPPTISAAWMGA